ncbi:Piwi-like protein 1 [Chamberlinius hualienensis]
MASNPDRDVSAGRGRGILLARLGKTHEICEKKVSEEPDKPHEVVESIQKTTVRRPVALGRGIKAPSAVESLLSPGKSSISATQSASTSVDRGSVGVVTGAVSKLSIGRGVSRRPLPQEVRTLTAATSLSSPPMLVDVESMQPIATSQKVSEIEQKKPVYFRGNSGDQQSFVVNYIPVRVQPGYSVYQYHVSFQPEQESRQIRFKLIGSLVDRIGETKSFDGTKLSLPQKMLNDFSNYRTVHPVDGTAVNVQLKYVGESRGNDCVQHFNILLRRAMKMLEMVQIGRHYYNPKLNIEVPNFGLSLWPGFITNITDYEGGLMLCAETAHRVLRTETVYDILRRFGAKGLNFQDHALKMLVGCVVITHYNNKTYRIDDILWNQNPSKTFQRGDQVISYVHYYKSQYNIDIKDHNQPLLLHNFKTRSPTEEVKMLCTIPELCYLTGLTDDMRKDNNLMRNLSQYTRLDPSKKQEELIRFVKAINECSGTKQLLSRWGVELVPDLLKVPGRIFSNEMIVFGNNTVPAGDQANWARYSTSSSVLNPVNITNWAVVFTRKDSSRVRDFCRMLPDVGKQLGINISEPNVRQLEDDSIRLLSSVLQEIIRPNLQLVVVVNPTPRDDRYNLIKKLCCCDYPIPSQVINSRTIEPGRKLRSVTQKILLQLNCKLGGELWSIKVPLTGLMVCGMDSYHSPAGDGSKSVLGFVASMNSCLTRWYSDVKFQIKGEELGSQLNVSLIRALQKYHDVNHCLPNRIIFVRDGVSDGQLDCVSNYELEQLTTAFSYFPEYQPQYMLTVVQKRINARIFKQQFNPRGQPLLSNPPPGSVIDQQITRKYLCDFFLISQHVTQGTVSPSHYIVVCNTVTTKQGLLTPDQIQQIMYKLTHLYYNWPGTIRVPAPCQYAHKLASLVGQNIKRIPSEHLMDRLFFL